MSNTDARTGIRRLAPWLGLAGLAALVFGSVFLESRELPPAAIAALAAGLLIGSWSAGSR